MKEYKKGDQEYTDFVKSGLNVGFTDDQIDFLWSWFETPPVLETPTVKEPATSTTTLVYDGPCSKSGNGANFTHTGPCLCGNPVYVAPPSNSEKEECCVCVEGGEGGMFPGCPCKCHQEEAKECFHRFKRRNGICEICGISSEKSMTMKLTECDDLLFKKEEVKEDTKKEDVKECRHKLEIVSLSELSRCKYCFKTTSEIVSEYTEPPKEPCPEDHPKQPHLHRSDGGWTWDYPRKEPVKKPLLAIFNGKIDVNESLRRIAKYLDETK